MKEIIIVMDYRAQKQHVQKNGHIALVNKIAQKTNQEEEYIETW